MLLYVTVAPNIYGGAWQLWLIRRLVAKPRIHLLLFNFLAHPFRLPDLHGRGNPNR